MSVWCAGIVNMGSHDLFLGEVVGCFTDGEVLSCETLFGNDQYTMKLDDGRLEVLTLGYHHAARIQIRG